MGLENSGKKRVKVVKERAIKLFKEKLRIQIQHKVKWFKDVELNKKVILVSSNLGRISRK